MRRPIRSAFTLIELLTVIAITAILLTIIIVPIFQSYNMTRAAQAFSDAQDKARLVTERISREIGNGVGVRDNSGYRGVLNLVVPARPGAPTPTVLAPVQYIKLDIIKAAQGEPDPSLPSGSFIDPVTGKIDPSLRAPKGQVVLPASQSTTLIRYYVGPNDPEQDYNNPYDGLLMARNVARDNLFVLYRAEVQAYVWSRVQNKYVVNKAFFFDMDRDSDPATHGPRYDDPDFFNPQIPVPAYSIPDPDGTPDPSKLDMVRNWRRRSEVLTEVSRYDMIQPVYDKATRQVTYNGDVPQLIPLVQFRPTRVSSEPAEGMVAVRLAEETDNASKVAPDVYRTLYGGWSNPIIRVFPENYAASPSTTGYFIARPDAATGHFRIFAYSPTMGGNEMTTGTPVFDLTNYEEAIAQRRPYPFVQAVLPGMSDPNLRASFVGFYPDAVLGKIVASFGINEVGDPGIAPPANDVNNFPLAATGSELNAIEDPGTGAVWSGAGYKINDAFNRSWNDYPDLHPNLHRFIDLRVTPQGDGSASPLDPDNNVGFRRAKIVVGSEIVYGPDQNPGPHFRQPTRYTRINRGSPGPNQYRINYVDQPEPDYAAMGVPAPPPTYTPTDFTSAVIQPRFKAGYIQLNSNPSLALPGDDPATPANEGLFQIYYRFQFTAPDDIMAVDYDSRQLMSVLLTIRNYPQSNLPNPQTVTLTSTAKVRNYLR